MDGRKEPRKPFQVYVTKADLVPDKIAKEINKHRKGGSLVGTITLTNQYGLWDMKQEEVLNVAEFLESRHSGVALPVPHKYSLDFKMPLRYGTRHGGSDPGRRSPAV